MENAVKTSILNKIQENLEAMNPSNPLYKNKIDKIVFGYESEVLEDDLPMIEIIEDGNSTSESPFALSVNQMVTLPLKFVVSSPAQWEDFETERLLQDIKTCIMQDPTLDSLAVFIKPSNTRKIVSDNKETQMKKNEIGFQVKYLEIY